jgi:hypothetical protein
MKRSKSAHGLFLLMLAACMPVTGSAESLPPLWGYGIKSCDHYASAWVGAAAGVEADIAEVRRYSDWLSGFVSALNLSIGRDVLAGADLEGALRRVYMSCDEQRQDDFFNATMTYLKTLSRLR